MLKFFIPVLIIFTASYCLNLSCPEIINDLITNFKNIHLPEQKKKSSTVNKTDNLLTISQLKNILASHNILLLNRTKTIFSLINGKQALKISTSLNPELQKFIISKLDTLKKLTRGKPRYIAIAVMEPETGRIVAMAGFDLSDPLFNPCTNGQFPAASVFKIITASAAIENCGYNPNTSIYFNGGKYTLYRRQLKERKNRYTIKVSFAHAFAESINPVFGKIGSRYLGGKILKKYSAAFGFNNNIDSDFPFKTGHIKITDKPYQWAEVGCGFNETTTISPIFALVLSGTLLNSGARPIPTVVDSVKNADGKILYTRKKQTSVRIIKPSTAKTVIKMMEKTITTGTAKKSFRGFKRDRILSKLTIGGKTGSIYNKSHTIKYDWFTGFAKTKQNKKKIVLAVLVGHRKYIGTRAARYGRIIIKKYFSLYFDPETQN